MKLLDKRGTNVMQKISTHRPGRQGFSSTNCKQKWLLHGEKPFKQGLDLGSIASRRFPNCAQSPSVQATSLFRHLLQKLTDPPSAIQTYAVRVTGNAGRDRKLQTLPDDVQTILIDLSLDMLGYGRPEISCPAGVQLEESRFFSSLGNTYDERSTARNVLIEEREDWRKQMNKSLQVALRDVRNYVYGEKDGVYQWIKNSRQKRGEEREDHGGLDPNAAMLQSAVNNPTRLDLDTYIAMAIYC
ncbi:unnamed protein product [Nippostrongylus brasiliensis]|uniref:Peptidase_M16_M domain-containing protein n=1 Tax=Nippostrongylus brasiliensis TaxID=27835 RepID=A0A0N4YFD4_NIPBR|nr:unnamed protein product [Nippostrongylus brasiliensis]